MPSKPWWEPSLFPWAQQLEAQYPALLAEFLALYRLRSTAPSDAPDSLEPGWGLAGSRRGNSFDVGLVDGAYWREFVFWDRTQPHTANLARAPVLSAILAQMPEATGCWFAQIHYSVLGPRTRLRPHCGATNYRLTAHLGLVIPETASARSKGRPLIGIRVANETRQWEAGRVMVFDDSYEHEVLLSPAPQSPLLSPLP